MENAAKAEMKIQETKRQAKEADEDVLKWLRMIAVSKQHAMVSPLVPPLAIQAKEEGTQQEGERCCIESYTKQNQYLFTAGLSNVFIISYQYICCVYKNQDIYKKQQ